MTSRNPFSAERKRARASECNERGRALDREGRSDDAIREYERACRIDPSWSVPWYNLGLVYKYAGDWERSLERNRRAAELDPSDQATWWNLGIAATALGRWDLARRAWRGCGIDLPDGEGPVDLPCGRTPVRLAAEEGAEVVWCDRIDPARARIRSIPLPDSGHRFEDLVLHDGAPNGYRRLGDREVPVFDCLALLEASPFSTFEAQVELADPTASVATLEQLADEREAAAEDWSTSVRVLCQACSEGRPHDTHEPPPVERPRRIAIAARSPEEARDLLDEWRRRDPSVRVLSVETLLDASERRT